MLHPGMALPSCVNVNSKLAHLKNKPSQVLDALSLTKIPPNSEQAKKITQSIPYSICKDLCLYNIVENAPNTGTQVWDTITTWILYRKKRGRRPFLSQKAIKIRRNLTSLSRMTDRRPVISARMRKPCGLTDWLGHTYGDVGAPPKLLSATAAEEEKRSQEGYTTGTKLVEIP